MRFTTATTGGSIIHSSQHNPQGSGGTEKMGFSGAGAYALQVASKASKQQYSQGGMLTNSGFSGWQGLQTYNKGIASLSQHKTSCHRVLMGKHYSDRLDATGRVRQGLLTDANGSWFSVGIAVPTTLSFLCPFSVWCVL